MMKRFLRCLSALLLALTCACSTTRVLREGEYRLASNKIVLEDGRKSPLDAGELNTYIRQKPNTYFLLGWNPFLNLYNWSNPDSDKGFFNKLCKKIGAAPVVLDPALVPDSEENIGNHLHYLGYYHARVQARIDTVRRLARVTYYIEPGPRTRIDSVVYRVQEGEFAAHFKADSAHMLVHAGDFLNEKALEAESIRSAAYFRNLGYYDLDKNFYAFEADTLGDKNILYYNIHPFSRGEMPKPDFRFRKYRFGDVSVTRSRDLYFRDTLFNKLCTIRPGALYREKTVNTSYARFTALRIFNNVAIHLTPVDTATVDCNVKLGESSQIGCKANIELSSNSSGLIGISPKLTLYHKNIFGGGERLNLGFSGNFQFQPNSPTRSHELSVSAGLSFPRFLGLSYAAFKGPNIPRTDFKLSYTYQSRPEFTRHLSDFSYGYTGQWGKDLYFNVYPLRIGYAKLTDLDESYLPVISQNPYLWDSYQDHIDAGVGTSLLLTNTTDIVPRIPSHSVLLNFDISGNVLSLFNRWMPLEQYDVYDGEPDEIPPQHLLFGVPYSQYVRMELSLAKTFRWGRENGQALALRLNGGIGYAYGNSYSLHFEKRFYVGGASSMRAWQARALGPGFSPVETLFKIPSQTGDMKLEADVEYRFKMFWKLEGALFAEAGNVWERGEQYPDWLSSIAMDWGLGLRVNLDFILLRVDAGFKLYEPCRAAGQRWLTPGQWFGKDGFAVHFGVGYPF